MRVSRRQGDCSPCEQSAVLLALFRLLFLSCHHAPPLCCFESEYVNDRRFVAAVVCLVGLGCPD